MAGAEQFEANTVDRIKGFFEYYNKLGIAYRLREAEYAQQPIDIVVDSPERIYYIGIECKSTTKGTDRMYFSSHFSKPTKKTKEHQVTRISKFLKNSGRFGILAIEYRVGQGHGANEIYFVPWFHVQRAFEGGQKYLDYETIKERYPRFKKMNGIWNLEYCINALKQF